MSERLRGLPGWLSPALLFVGGTLLVLPKALDPRRHAGSAWVERAAEGPLRFELPLLGGGRFSSDTPRTGPLLLAFWASWCGPCKVELPRLARVAARLGASAQVVAVNIESDDERATVARVVRDLHLELPVALDGGGLGSACRAELLPTAVIVDPQGRIVDSLRGLHDEAEFVARLVRHGAAAR
jgi:thiol-disulfide isomerase/thioredoxin